MARYYSTQRPVAPGTYPMPYGNKVTKIENFGVRQHVKEIGRPAWGYLEYELPVSPVMLRDYELVGVPADAAGRKEV